MLHPNETGGKEERGYLFFTPGEEEANLSNESFLSICISGTKPEFELNREHPGEGERMNLIGDRRGGVGMSGSRESGQKEKTLRRTVSRRMRGGIERHGMKGGISSAMCFKKREKTTSRLKIYML